MGGGVAIGRITQFVGVESGTKTTTALHTARNAQKLFGMTLYMSDVEGTSDDDYFSMLGLDLNKLMYSRPEGQEEALQLILDVQKSEKAQIIILDSIASLVPTKERDAAMDETVQMGLRSKMLGNFYQKFNAQNNYLTRNGKTPATLIVLNQVREKFAAYGDPETAPGGRSTGFYSSHNVWFKQAEWITGKAKVKVGQQVKFNVKKNKLGARGKHGEFDFYFEDNILGIPKLFVDNAKEVVVEAVYADLIEQKGAWFYYGKEQFQGVDKLTAYLRENPEVISELREKLLDRK